MKMRVTQPPKIVVRIFRKPSNILDQWIGYPKILGFSQALEISGQYLLLRTVILQKKVSGCLCRDSLASG